MAVVGGISTLTDKLTGPLQESILALLSTNDREGRVASGLLDASQFNDTYQDFARRVIEYHRKHGKAPGRAHLDDLVDDILNNPQHRQHKATVRIIEGVLDQSESINPQYLLTRVNDFAKRSRLKEAITAASQRYVQDEDSTSDVEKILVDAVRARSQDMDSGVRLTDKKRALTFLDHTAPDYSVGIPQLDHSNVGLHYGQILMLVAPKGAGKSWWVTDIGKRCVVQKAKVVHYTLENPWSQTLGRYYQSFFAVPPKGDDVSLTHLQLDKLGRLKGHKREVYTPHISLDSPKIRKYLGRKIDDWGARLDNLVVKQFQSGTLTMDQLEAHLEYLEVAEEFIPNVMLLDYPDLMSLKGSDKRIALGDTFVQLRGLLERRKMCGGFPTQGNRTSWDAETVKASMISEDASKVMTSDMVLIYSQTPSEKALNLARLAVPYNRNGRQGFSVVISQSYNTGQYVVDSAHMGNNYWDVVPREEQAEDGD